MIKSHRELAKALGVTLSVANTYVNDARWPYGRGPWKNKMVDLMQDWRTQNLQPDQNDPSDNTAMKLTIGQKMKLAIEKEKLDKLKRDNQRDAGEVHDVEACDVKQMTLHIAMRKDFLAIPDRAPFGADVKKWFKQEMEWLADRYASKATSKGIGS